MKKLYILVLALAVVNLSNAQYFTKIWTKLAGDFPWFSATSNNTTGIAYNPVTNKVLVADRNNNIYILNATTGAQEGTVTLGGDLGTEGFKFNKIRVTSDGVIYGITLTNTLNSGAGPFFCKIYRWANQTTSPTLCANFQVYERIGDGFALSGSGANTVLYASGAGLVNNNAGPNVKIYVLTTNDGSNFLNTSTITVSSGTSQWANRSVDPIGTTPTDGLWIDMSGGPARRLTVTGSAPSLTATAAFNTTTGYNSGQVADSYCGMRYLAPNAGSGKKYLAFAGANNAGDGITMRLLDVTNEAAVTTVGTDTLWSAPNTPMTWNTNANGTGDVAFKNNGDGSYDIFYVATNNGIACVRSAQSLPASITNFSAALRNKKVQLSWSTVSEINNTSFEIEKSVNGKDFSSIGTVASKAMNGNSTSTLEYSFEDSKPFAGNNYYRLKQIDRDGKFIVSNTEVINFNNSQNFTVYVLQNPVKSSIQLNVKATANTLLHVNIVNTVGQTVLSKQINVSTGDNNIGLDASSLTSGTYFIKVKDIKNNSAEQNITVLKN